MVLKLSRVDVSTARGAARRLGQTDSAGRANTAPPIRQAGRVVGEGEHAHAHRAVARRMRSAP